MVERVKKDGSKMPKARHLNRPGSPGPKQRRFIDAYLGYLKDDMKDEEAAKQAAEDAGYKPKELVSLRSNPKVAKHLQAVRKKNEARIMRQICTVLPMNRTERRSLLAEIATKKAAYKTEHRLKAIEMDAKITGDFIEHKRVDHLLLHKRVEDMSNEDLEKILAGGTVEDEE